MKARPIAPASGLATLTVDVDADMTRKKGKFLRGSIGDAPVAKTSSAYSITLTFGSGEPRHGRRRSGYAAHPPPATAHGLERLLSRRPPGVFRQRPAAKRTDFNATSTDAVFSSAFRRRQEQNQVVPLSKRLRPHPPDHGLMAV